MPRTIDECRAAYGRVYEAQAGGVTFVYKRPSAADWRRFRAAQTTSAVKFERPDLLDGFGAAEAGLEALEMICRFCVVSHSAEEMDARAEVHLDLFHDLGTKIAATFEAEQAALGKA